MTLRGRSAVITGASSGIGRALALELAQRGARLHLLGRDETRLAEVARQAEAAGGAGEAHAFDLLDDRALAAFAEALAGEALDVLVHSAGGVRLGPLAEAPVADLDWQYRLNVRVPCLLTQLLLPGLRAAGGQVVFVNSGAGRSAKAEWGAYAASKHALKALADSLRAEEAGLRVLSVYPGRTASPMQRWVHEMEGKPYDPERFVQPEDVAQQVVSALELPPRSSVEELVIRPTG